MDIKSYILMGIEIHPMSIERLHFLIKESVLKRLKIIISSQNLHSVYLYHKNEKFKEFQKKTFKRVDGMPLIFWGKFLGFPLKREERVTWVDWMHPFMKFVCSEKMRVFYLGSTEKVAQQAKCILEERYLGLRIQVHCGFFDISIGSGDNSKILSAINEYAPDILIVGMGMPRQEYWILDHYAQINVPVILTSGAAMEYVCGAVSYPPRWMGQFGLEWLYRLLENPTRFWKRYLIEPQLIVALMINDLIFHVFNKRT